MVHRPLVHSNIGSFSTIRYELVDCQLNGRMFSTEANETCHHGELDPVRYPVPLSDSADVSWRHSSALTLLETQVHRALIICNSIFPDDPGELWPLRGPVRDGLVLWKVLVDTQTGYFSEEGIEVLFERDSHEVMRAADGFFSEATLVLYYSGYGRRASGELILCSRDTNTKRLQSTGIPSERLGRMIGEINARAIVVVLDCCHGGAFKGEFPIKDFGGPWPVCPRRSWCN
jgi:Caspase domain